MLCAAAVAIVYLPLCIAGQNLIRPTPRERVALEAVQRHVLSEFDGDVLKAFSSVDTNKDGLIESIELQKFLTKVGLGDYWLRPSWSKRALNRLDADEPLDGRLSPGELRRAFPESVLPIEFKDVENCYDATCIARNGPMQI